MTMKKSFQQWEYDVKVCKFFGKTSHECYKLIWQWSKEKSISLSLFEALCEAASKQDIVMKKPGGIYEP